MLIIVLYLPVATKLVRIGVDGGQLVGPAVVGSAMISGSSASSNLASVVAGEVMDKLGDHVVPVLFEVGNDGLDLGVDTRTVAAVGPANYGVVLVVSSEVMGKHLTNVFQMKIASL